MGRRVVTSVRVQDPQGTHVVLAPGDEVPAWAAGQVTNPAAFGDSDAVEVPPGDFVTVESGSAVKGEGSDMFTAAAVAAGAPDYGAMKVAELRDLAAQRGLSAEGAKADIVAALETADRV